MKQYFFLSGIQRSGSTLLGALLNQNPTVHVSPTSPLLDFLCRSEDVLQKLNQQYTFDISKVSPNLHVNNFDSFYKHVEKSYIIDKHRGWPRNAATVKAVLNIEPKIILTYRPIKETITSFIKLAMKDPNNAVDMALIQQNIPVNNRNRANFIWEKWTYEIYDSVRYGIKNHRENIHVVYYDDLVSNTQATLNKIYDFLELPNYTHEFENIDNACKEDKDEIWGFTGLHDVRSKVEKQSLSVEDVLDKDMIDFFDTYDKLLGL